MLGHLFLAPCFLAFASCGKSTIDAVPRLHLDPNTYLHDEKFQHLATALRPSPLNETSDRLYEQRPPVHSSRLPKELYQEQILAKTPIACVDVLVYCPQSQKYLLLERSQRPILGIHAHIGGRMFKGESFFDAAARKVRDECGLGSSDTGLGLEVEVAPVREEDGSFYGSDGKLMRKRNEKERAQLRKQTLDRKYERPTLVLHYVINTFNTMFEDSSVPEQSTQTINTVVYAELFFPMDTDARSESPELAWKRFFSVDEFHSGYIWLSEKGYLEDVNMSWAIKKALVEHLINIGHFQREYMNKDTLPPPDLLEDFEKRKLMPAAAETQFMHYGFADVRGLGEEASPSLYRTPQLGFWDDSITVSESKDMDVAHGVLGISSSSFPPTSQMFAMEKYFNTRGTQLKLLHMSYQDLFDFFVANTFYHLRDSRPGPPTVDGIGLRSHFNRLISGSTEILVDSNDGIEVPAESVGKGKGMQRDLPSETSKAGTRTTTIEVDRAGDHKGSLLVERDPESGRIRDVLNGDNRDRKLLKAQSSTKSESAGSSDSKIPDDVYKQILNNTATPAVDVVLYDCDRDRYFFYIRGFGALKGRSKMLGARMFRMETYFSTAWRKLRDYFELTEGEVMGGSAPESDESQSISESQADKKNDTNKFGRAARFRRFLGPFNTHFPGMEFDGERVPAQYVNLVVEIDINCHLSKAVTSGTSTIMTLQPKAKYTEGKHYRWLSRAQIEEEFIQSEKLPPYFGSVFKKHWAMSAEAVREFEEEKLIRQWKIEKPASASESEEL